MKNKLLNSALALTSIFLITGCGEEEIDTSKLSSSTDNSNITSNVQSNIVSNTVSNTVSNNPVTSNRTTTTSNKTTTTTKPTTTSNKTTTTTKPTTTSNKTTTTASNTKTLTCTKNIPSSDGIKQVNSLVGTFVNNKLVILKNSTTYTAPTNYYFTYESRIAEKKRVDELKKQYETSNIKYSTAYNSNYTKYILTVTFNVKNLTMADMKKINSTNPTLNLNYEYDINKKDLISKGYNCK